MENELKPVRCCKNCEHIKQAELFGIEFPWCKSKHKVINRPNKRRSALLCVRHKKRRIDNGK